MLFVMKNLVKYSFISLIILQSALYAEHHLLRFDRISISEGLSHSSVNTIMQDKTGFMWFGTYEGLNRYDGFRFKVYRHDPQDEQSLSHDFVNILYEDSHGRLWVGTEGGLSLYNPDKENFTNYVHDPLDSTTLSYNSPHYILEDAKGFLWISTQGGGLNRFDPKTGTFKRFLHDPYDSTSITSNQLSVIHIVSKDTMLIATIGRGIQYFDMKREIFKRIRFNPEKMGTVSDAIVTDFIVHPNQTIWICTQTGLVKYNRLSEEVTIFQNSNSPSSLSDNNIKELYRDSKGTMWIGTYTGGVNIFDPLSGEFVAYQSSRDHPQSIGSNTIYDMYEDRSGILWLSTWGAGLSKYDPEKAKFPHFKHIPGEENTISGSNVISIQEDRHKNLWIGTRNNGLNRIDHRTGRIQHFRHKHNRKNGPSSNTIYEVYMDSKGIIWVGTDTGLNRYNPQDKTFTWYLNDPNDPTSCDGRGIFTIYEDSHGSYWLGGWEIGLDRFDPRTGVFTHFTNNPADSTSIPNNVIWTTFEDSHGIFWVGTRGGLAMFNRKKCCAHNFYGNPTDPKALFSDDIGSILETSDGELWISTHGGGISRFNRADSTFSTWTTSHGLCNNVVYGILEDDRGNLWMSTNRGLSCFNRKLKSFTNYDVSDGLQSNEFNLGAFYKRENGEMLFGGINGYNQFFPHTIDRNQTIPPVVFTDFLLYNEILQPGDTVNNHVPLTNSIVGLDTLKLSYMDDFFSIQFAALLFSAPGQHQYQYTLKGFDKNWIHTNTHRPYATYTNLDPGAYTFKVRASNHDGEWNDKSTQLRIVITTPWWKAWWFHTLVVLGVIAIIAFISSLQFKIRTNKLRAEKESALRQTASLKADQANMQAKYEANQHEAVKKQYNLTLRLNEKLAKEIESRKAAEMALQKANKQLEELAAIDSVTGISNRRIFEETLIKDWRRMQREQKVLTLVLADIDHFKRYNDTYGHQAGDTCLHKIATILDKAMARSTDLAARFGGEEFALILPGTSIQNTASIINKIRNKVTEANMEHSSSLTEDHVTLSFGISSCIPANSDGWVDLIKSADEALYEAKKNGRNQYVIK